MIDCLGFHNSHLILSKQKNMALMGFVYFRKKYDAVSLLILLDNVLNERPPRCSRLLRSLAISCA